MTKSIRAVRPDKCIGCELCVFECQRQAKIVGLEGAMIRILKNTDSDPEKPVYLIDIDPRIDTLNIEDIKEICPKSVFEIIET